MQFLIDECVADEIGRLLQQAGHDVAFVSNVAPAAADIDILPLGFRLGRIIVTHDYDYGDLIFRDGASSFGVIIIGPNCDLRKVAATITELGDTLAGSLTTVGTERTRQRTIPER